MGFATACLFRITHIARPHCARESFENQEIFLRVEYLQLVYRAYRKNRFYAPDTRLSERLGVRLRRRVVRKRAQLQLTPLYFSISTITRIASSM